MAVLNYAVTSYLNTQTSIYIMGGEVIPFSFLWMAGFVSLPAINSSDVSEYFVLLVVDVLILVMALRVWDDINADD